jgi:hypothetical protein
MRRDVFPPDGSSNNKPKLFILCGNINEFHFWARRIYEKTQEYEVKYISSTQVIRGYRNSRYICLGNWFRTFDNLSEEAIEIMRISDFKELYYSDIFGFESEEAEREYYENSGGPVPMTIEEFISEEEMLL